MTEPRRASVALAGGGTAGHVEPALAVADVLRAIDPAVSVLMIGTDTGLETRLVPARGHRLATIPRVPLPRRPTPALIRLPGALAGAVRAAGAILDREHVTVAVGFGGYVALPVYLAARRRGIPIVVHEANARAGLANRIGARLSRNVAVAHAGSGLPHAQVVGIPLRQEISALDRDAALPAARASFGLAADGPVLLVSGGSSGARRLNDAVVGAAPDLAAAGIQVLHHAGINHADGVGAAVAAYPSHHVVAYVERMDQAYAAADLMLARAGAMTCAELAAVGLPAVYVPLPIGNGEQRLNARPVVDAGGGLLVGDADLDAAYVREHVVPLLGDLPRLAAMSAAARTALPGDAAALMADLALAASAKMDR